jgi:hypothetical protein
MRTGAACRGGGPGLIVASNLDGPMPRCVCRSATADRALFSLNDDHYVNTVKGS